MSNLKSIMLGLSFLITQNAIAAGGGNDFLFFNGDVQTLDTTITSQSGVEIAVSGDYNVNKLSSYDGLGGNDTLIGSQLNDYLLSSTTNVENIENFYLSSGHDVFDLSDQNIEINIFSAGGDDIIFSGLQADYVSGGGGDDFIDAGTGNDRIHGDSGNDVLYGGAGDDDLYGGADDDDLYGGIGNDTYHYNSGHDTIVETANGSNDILRFNMGVSLTDLMFDIIADDLMISVTPSLMSSSIFIEDQFASANSGIEYLWFGDGSNFDMSNLSLPTVLANNVPEPTALSLLFLGLLSMGFAQSQRARRLLKS